MCVLVCACVRVYVCAMSNLIMQPQKHLLMQTNVLRAKQDASNIRFADPLWHNAGLTRVK